MLAPAVIGWPAGSAVLGLGEDRLELLARLLELGFGIAALQHVGEGDAVDVAELGDRGDLRQARPRYLDRARHAVDPFARRLQVGRGLGRLEGGAAAGRAVAADEVA